MTKEKIRNTLTSKERTFYVRESDVTKVVKIIQDVTRDSRVIFTNITTGNCGWARVMDLYFVVWHSSQKDYAKICEKCGSEKIILYPDTVGYTGYQF